ncbi:MAG: ATP-binding protein [Calditerrivibrio sp.]|nr:ATP-binding protein [Calditerrivibrio sp.]
MSLFLKLRLKNQFIIYFIFFTVLIILSTSYFYVNKYKEDINNVFDKYGQNILENSIPLLFNYILVEDYYRIQETLNHLRKNKDIDRISLVDTKGKIIADTDISKLGLKFEGIQHEDLALFKKELRVNNLNYGTIYLYLNKSKIRDEISLLYGNVIVFVVFFSVAAIFIGTVISTLLTKPLNNFLNLIETFKTKRYIPSSENIIAPREIAVIYSDFYDMMRLIEEREASLNIAMLDLKNIKDFIQQIVDSLPISLVTVNSKLVITFYNSKFLNLFGLQGDLVNKNLADVLQNQDFDDIYKIIKESKEAFYRRMKLSTHPNSFFDITLFKIETLQGINIGISIEDVTEEVEKDNIIFHTQKMDSLGVLAGGIAHDINNVLAAIKNSLSVLKMMNCPENTKPILDTMEKSVYRASNIVKQILSFTRKQELKINIFSLNNVIKDILSILQNTADKSIEIEANIMDEELEILGDENQIEQALLNICINGCHSMTIMRSDGKKGGKLSIDVVKVSKDNQGFAKISISDTGVGIPREILDKIFDPFFTTKKAGEGTGLGLSIVDRIIRDHNGSITVRSEVNMGTTVDILLPISQLHSLKIESDKNLQERFDITALLVDDDNLVVESNIQLLNSLGINTISISSPLEAIDIFEGNKDKIDVCLIDIMMPKMSGIELSEMLLKIKPDLKIVLLSGFFKDPTIETFIKEKGLHFLQKPFSVDELVSVLKKIYS